MNTAHTHTYNRHMPSIASKSLPRTWMSWAVFFFFCASVFGLAMRYFFIGEIPFFEYKHLLHAHSHIALLGWGYLLLTGLLTFSYVKSPLRLKLYKKILILTVIANIGMMLSFPFQGYGGFSIAFSTMHLVLSYVFAYSFFRDLKKSASGTAKTLICLSIIWMLISSIGLWAIAPIGAILGRMHPLYFMSVQWFLHFQLNGWFVYALLGLVLIYMETKGHPIKIGPKTLLALHLSLFLTYALPVSWSMPATVLLYLNGLGVVLQAFAYFIILRPIITQLHSSYCLSKSWINSMLWIGIISLLAKALIQATLILPDVANVAYTIRNYVIGFVHLVMLGAITFGLGALALKNNWLRKNRQALIAWVLLAIGFITSEFLILGQGILLWAKLGFIPHYHLLVFIASAFLPLGLALMLLAQWFSYPPIQKSPKSIQIQKSHHKSKITETMKSTVLMSMGIALLLMASCGGGGSNENQGSYTPPSAKKEKVADPKGIGEIKEVILGDEIDQVLAEKGKAILDMKCTACHQYNAKRLVGPGFEGLTNRRRSEWIMNMITNVDVMLNEDPVAQKLLEECLTRMPNQNISIDESRQILEYFRKNDREKTGGSDAAMN
ncbi:cytochrome c [Belliella marina]|uniref:Cytochrome c n=1 Tax=Belliella marina TaxID=1644146 RepID=A0ABW4VQK9_9BACT